MKITVAWLMVFLVLAPITLIGAESPSLKSKPEQRQSGKAHTPPQGSAERRAIMDVLREEVRRDQGVEPVFVVNYLKVHNGWAWVDVTPNRKDGTNLYEGKEALLHRENGRWRSMALPTQDADDDTMFGELSNRYLRKLKKKYPSVPMDIFPK